jgi:hypothetical protein
MKQCECGCGQLIPELDAKGRPRRFVPGHHVPSGSASPYWKGGRLYQKGYPLVYQPGHPRANRDGYVFEQVIQAEKALGKPLPDGALVHHMNGTKKGPLAICPDIAYHQLVHQRLRAYKACKHPSWRKCKYCKRWTPPEKLVITNTHSFHADCQKEYDRNRYASRRR